MAEWPLEDHHNEKALEYVMGNIPILTRGRMLVDELVVVVEVIAARRRFEARMTEIVATTNQNLLKNEGRRIVEKMTTVFIFAVEIAWRVLKYT